MPRFCISAVLLLASAVSAGAAEPAYWRQRIFFIPYQPAPQSRFASPAEKVLLSVSRDGVSGWAVLQEARPEVRGFGYHAPADGEYWFALQTADRKDKLTPATITQAQLHVLVDTTPPTLQLSATLDAAGRMIVRYEARDAAIRPESLRLEAQAVAGGPWEPLTPNAADINQPDRLVGQLVWKPTTSGSEIRLRGTIADKAGNQGTGATQTSLIGPQLAPPTGPALAPSEVINNPIASSAPPLTAAVSDQSPPAKSAFDWPAPSASASKAPAPSGDPFLTVSQAPSQTNAPPTAMEPRIPSDRPLAQLVADGANSPKPTLPASSLPNPFAPPPLFDALSPTQPNASPPVAAPTTSVANNGWSGTPSPSAGTADAAVSGVRWVNSTTFDIDYDLQTVGPWGVSKVEMWATRDGGKQWVNFGSDADNRSPMRVSVPAAGVYGFRLVVSGANGAAAPTPASGDQPELAIGVDLEPPQVALQAAEIGQGTLADHLIIRWSASDENLDSHPIGLFYSTESDGPWSTIATDLANSGEYAWRLLRQVPEKLFLRIEVRDKAGNVTVRQSPAPVVLHLPQPTGRLRSVRPVAEDPSRFRTAAGARGPIAQ
jgi:hypothetical protein